MIILLVLSYILIGFLIAYVYRISQGEKVEIGCLFMLCIAWPFPAIYYGVISIIFLILWVFSLEI